MIPAAIALTALLAQDKETIERKLVAVKVDAHFTDAPLAEVADYLRDVVGINVVIDRDAQDKGATVSIKVKDVSARTLLNLVLKAHDLGYLIQENILRICLKEKALGDVHLEVYDVQDIVRPIQNFPGREITFGDEGMIFTDTPSEPNPEMGDFLVELVRNFTGGAAWDENDRATMNYQNGLLIVKQTPEVHRKIQKILLTLRSIK
jgi:type II secretory pathway component GspD/PulD (secretin)